MDEAAPALPSLYEVQAPAGWRVIEFISDLHLSESTPATFAAWQAYLQATDADAVFMLGDLFEVWVGDDAAAVAGSFESRGLDVLADAASRRHLAFMAGNRDFLLGSATLRRAGLTGLQDPTVLSAWGQRVLLTHGDALCLDDGAYQAFRRQVRAPAWRDRFLAQPLAERRAQARRMRDASQAHQRAQPAAHWSDVDAAAAVGWMHGAGAREMVHGHTHRPGSEVLAPGFTRHVLSDWDLEAPVPRAEVLRLTRDGFSRRRP